MAVRRRNCAVAAGAFLLSVISIAFNNEHCLSKEMLRRQYAFVFVWCGMAFCVRKHYARG